MQDQVTYMPRDFMQEGTLGVHRSLRRLCSVFEAIRWMQCKVVLVKSGFQDPLNPY